MNLEELQDCIPRNKFDLERGKRLSELGYPAIAPITDELFVWIQDMNWPVARYVYGALAPAGIALLPHIQKVLATDDIMWKYWVMGFARESRELAMAMKPDLVRVSIQPTPAERAEKLHERADDILEMYGLN